MMYDLRLTVKLLLALCIIHCASFSSFSQTEYAPPKLTCVRSVASQTELNWSLPASPNPCFSAYEIYASAGNKNGPYTLQASITNPAQTSVTLNISTGNPPYHYFYMVNRGTCNNPVPLTGKTSDTLFTDKPTAVEIKKVSIVNNQVAISWLPSPSPEVIGYFIFNNLDGSPSGFNNPDTVFGRLTTSFIDTHHLPSSSPVTYAVRAFYSCQSALPNYLEGSITPPDFRHSTMRLKNQTAPDSCNASVSINWTPYLIGSTTSGVVNYEIQTNYQNAGFVTQSVLDNTTTVNIVQNIPYLIQYCIRVKANLTNGDSSFSNVICFDSLRIVQVPRTDYMRNISIENGNMVIEYRKDTLASPQLGSPILYRSPDGIVFTPLSNTADISDRYSLVYTDVSNAEINPGNNTFSYAIRLNMPCGNFHFSDTASTLRTGIKVKTNNRAEVLWGGFSIDNITFDHYRLDKIIGNDTVFIGNFSRTETMYAENTLFDYTIDSLEEVCYRVTAYFENNNDAAPREMLESHSNIVCVKPEPKAMVPQAFVPDGRNKTFKPFLLFAKADGYEFHIFDRWYHLVFSTNDVNTSWDGNYNGGPASSDGYIYVIKFKGKDDKEYTQTGTVMLLR
jgi:gliding motility-associated-like protein